MKKRHLLFPILLALGTVAGLVGSVAPWVPHQVAGLRVGAFDLFEVVKYLPGIRTGEVPLFREAFLLPLLVSAVMLALVPVVWQKAPRWVRWALPVIAAVIAAMALPPYPQIKTAYRDPEYRGQLILAAGTVCLVALSPLARRLPVRLTAGLVGLLVGVGTVVPITQSLTVRRLFVELYNAPIGVGWGLVSYLLGMALLLVGAVFGFVSADYECQE